MDTTYVGPFPSEHGGSGRELKTELRAEDSEAMPGWLDLGIYRYSDGEPIRYLRLDPALATQLRDALNTYLQEQ